MRYLKWSSSWAISLTGIYFAFTFILLFCEIKQIFPLIYFLRPIRVPLLMGLYFVTSTKRNKIYLGSLLFLLVGVLFFMGSSQQYLMYGSISYIIYRFLTIVLVWKGIGKVSMMPLTIASLPFFFISFYLILLIGEQGALMNFYPLVINGFLLSFLGGLALYHYILEDNNNPWLIISALLFVAQFFIFVIQKFYLSNEVFQPITALVFSVCQYTFYRSVIKQESFAIEIQSPKA